MTLYEYNMRMKVYKLKQADKDYDIHLQAWANWNVQAMKKQGKNKRVPVYRTFRQFFDYEKRVEDILKTNKQDDQKNRGIAKIMKKQKERKSADGKL